MTKFLSNCHEWNGFIITRAIEKIHQSSDHALRLPHTKTTPFYSVVLKFARERCSIKYKKHAGIVTVARKFTAQPILLRLTILGAIPGDIISEITITLSGK